MPTTVRNIKDDVRALIDELYEDGELKSSEDDDIKNIEANTVRYLNMAVAEAYEATDKEAEHIITTNEIQNLLGNNNQFNLVEFTGEEKEYPESGEGVVGAKGYFATVTSDSIVSLQEFNGTAWVELFNVVSVTDTPIDIKGSITPSNVDFPIRMVFKGTTYYQHQNRCLYKYDYKTFPDYKAYPTYAMPDDFGSLIQVIIEQSYKRYDISSTFKWERNDLIAIDSSFKGTHRIIYNKIPVTLVNDTDIVPAKNPLAIEFYKYYCAAKIATSENTDLVQFYEQKSNELKYLAFKKGPTKEQPIEDAYAIDYDYPYNHGRNGF